MGREFQRVVGFDDFNSGCMHGIFHFLDSHHMHSITRRMIPHRKRQPTISFQASRTDAFTHYASLEDDFMDAEQVPFLVEQKPTKSNPKKKSSRKPLKKEAVSKQMPTPSKLPSDGEFAKIGTDWKNSIIVLRKGTHETSSTGLNPPSFSKVTEESTNTCNAGDTKCNKKMETPVDQGMKVVLSKSVSFPIADPSHSAFERLSTPKHKQSEVWPFPNEAKYLILSEKSQFGGLKSKPSKYSLDSSEEFNNQWWHLFLFNHLKEVKRKIKRVLRERKKGRKVRDAMLRRVPSRHNYLNEEKETAEKQESEIHLNERASSLNASMDKYNKLFENSVSKETWNRSKSLALRAEDKIVAGDRTLKSCRGRFSLSDIDLISYEVSRDYFLSKVPTKPSVDCDVKDEDAHLVTEKIEVIEAVFGTEIKKKDGLHDELGFGNESVFVASRTYDELSEDVVEKGNEQNSSDQETCFKIDTGEDVSIPSLLSVVETSIDELLITEGSEFNPRLSSVDETSNTVKPENKDENVDTVIPLVGAQDLSLKFDNLSDADFNYVKDILDLSGFSENDYFGSCNLPDQPVDLSLFNELESYLHSESSLEEKLGKNCDHLLLFELINQVLVEINERSYTYFSKPFSFNKRICPIPKGTHLLGVVLARVSGYAGQKLIFDQSLEDIVSNDLGKDDGWMNIQPEAEFVALDLEDMIFDDLLDELFCL